MSNQFIYECDKCHNRVGQVYVENEKQLCKTCFWKK